MTGNSQWEADELGQTGETFLVGPDRLMRSQSCLLVEDEQSYLQELKKQQVSPRIIERIRRNNSPIPQKLDGMAKGKIGKTTLSEPSWTAW